MTKRIKELCEWVETVGYNSHAWIGGDWHVALHLLSKLMAKELEQRRQSTNEGADSDVTLKISFDSMLQLAEDTLGVPVLVTERDLLVRYPNIHLALLTYLVCLKSTVEHFDAKQIRSTYAPRLVFEAKNGMDASLPKCPICHEHVFIIERVIVERCVWHRACFKCTECGRLLNRGAFKKSKHGHECIQHAVRRILDAHESTSGSGSGTYDRYGGRSPRPNVAPPPRPKPKLPPKPSYLCSRANPVYESLDDVFGQSSSSASAPADSKRGYEELEASSSSAAFTSKPTLDASRNPFDDDDDSFEEGETSIGSSDYGGSTRSGGEEKENKNLQRPVTVTTTSASHCDEADNKADDSPPFSGCSGTSADDSSGSSADNSSCDSGVVLRMAKMFTAEAAKAAGASGQDPSNAQRTRASQPQLPSTPVAPPRPKRTSMLLTSRIHSPCSTMPRSPATAAERRAKAKLDLDDYPDYLCPFGEEEEENETAEEYPECKNPFADSDDESASGPPVPAPRSLPPPPPALLGTSDRPKVQPPPPPNGAIVPPCTPPQKPARTHLTPSEMKIQTLKISRKKTRAPLPPVLRKIKFTENAEEDPTVIRNRLKAIEEQMERVEVEGRAVEKEMLFQIATNPHTWAKSARADDWVDVLTRKLELMREQLHLLGIWREHFLNEVHSETEYYIRCLLEKDKTEHSEWEIQREADLTNLLIYIMEEKLKLDEYMADLQEGATQSPDDAKVVQKKTKLRKRVAMLTKRLKKKKTSK